MAEFMGSSENGKFQEALEDAIRVARENIPSERIDWTFVRAYGVYGGFAPENRVTVVIDATAPEAGSDGGRQTS